MGSTSQMSLRLATTAATGLALLLALPPAAGAQKARTKQLWATVNVCDTRKHPDTIGLRASMPGLAKRSNMLMRFRIQYFSADEERWRRIPDADSRWSRVARQKGGTAESGWRVPLTPVQEGGSWRLRGVVHFRWKRNGKVVRSARRITEGGHRSTTGADPRRYSSATCVIS
jgi:hypothetical protein